MTTPTAVSSDLFIRHFKTQDYLNKQIAWNTAADSRVLSYVDRNESFESLPRTLFLPTTHSA